MVFKWDKVCIEMTNAQNVFEVPRAVMAIIKQMVEKFDPIKKDGLVILITEENPVYKYNQIMKDYNLADVGMKDIYVSKNSKWIFEYHLSNNGFKIIIVHQELESANNTIHCNLPPNSIKRLRGLSNFLGKTQDEIIIEALDRIFIHYNPDESVL